jgi:hypothetical protein
MRVSVKPRRQNSHRADEGRKFPLHVQWVRGRRCLLEDHLGHQCTGKIEAHHVNEGHKRGMGQRAPDFWCVPLCSAAHAALHNAGHLTWQMRHGVNLIEAAKEYARLSPHRRQWEETP